MDGEIMIETMTDLARYEIAKDENGIYHLSDMLNGVSMIFDDFRDMTKYIEFDLQNADKESERNENLSSHH